MGASQEERFEAYHRDELIKIHFNMTHEPSKVHYLAEMSPALLIINYYLIKFKMTKIKIFKFAPESDEAITNLIQSVNVIKEGFFISDGNFGIMYKEKGDVGMDPGAMTNPISGELAKAQEQYLYQLWIEKKSEAKENLYRGIYDGFKKEMDEANEMLTKHKESPFAPVELQETISTKQGRLDEIKALFRNKKNGVIESEKEGLLKEAQTLEAELKPLVAETADLQKKYDAETKRLEAVISTAHVNMVNASAKVKENRELKEKARDEDKREAISDILTATALIKEISNSIFNKDTNLLELKAK